jgi:glutathione S-transferase
LPQPYCGSIVCSASNCDGARTTRTWSPFFGRLTVADDLKPCDRLDCNVLTENVAILTYLAKQFPDARLLPQNLLEEARCLSTMAWFASAVHPTFAHIIRPERFASDTSAQLNMKDTVRETFWAHCEEINGLLAGNEWMMGAQ